MKNAAAIRAKLDLIKDIEDPKFALAALGNLQYEIGVDACAEREVLRGEIKLLRKHILGNGDHEHSVLSRLKGVETCVEAFTKVAGKDIKDIKDALLGNFEGKVGLMDRVEKVEQIGANLVKGLWLVVAVILGQIALKIWGLF